MKERIFLIGLSRAGSHVAAALAGHGAVVVGVGNRTPINGDPRLRVLGVDRTLTVDESTDIRADIVLLAVADDAIAEVSSQWAAALSKKIGLERTIVFHLSGSLDERVLDAWAERGAAVASVHPVRSFATHATDSSGLDGIACGIETRDETARSTLESLMQRAGARTFRIAQGKKAIYHLAAVLASNASLALWDEAIARFEEADLSRADATALTESLVRGTLANMVRLGTEAALTGPVVRGDLSALKRHHAAIESIEDRRFYGVLMRRTLKLARRAHPERSALYDEVDRFLAGCE